MNYSKQHFLFQYNTQDTPIHRISAGIKLAVLCLSSFTLYGAPPLWLALYGLVLLAICIWAKLSWETIKKNCKFLCIYTVCIFAIKIIGAPLTGSIVWQTMQETFVFMRMLMLILFTASVFYETTSKIEIFTLCEHLERFVCRKKYTGAFSTIFTITIMCVPQVFENWAQLNYAYNARVKERKGIISAYRRLTALLPSLIEKLLRFALTAEKALKNRTTSFFNR
ncbi:MAG: CbiQ family ECF transporter T component [Treponema sp.]|uniref:CbiQ family ECF transporter T component n=1 Tax=Treponema sp. TaxID=166 RepID=UPI003FA2EAC0